MKKYFKFHVVGDFIPEIYEQKGKIIKKEYILS